MKIADDVDMVVKDTPNANVDTDAEEMAAFWSPMIEAFLASVSMELTFLIFGGSASVTTPSSCRANFHSPLPCPFQSTASG